MNKTNIVKRPEVEAFKLKAIKMDETTKAAQSLYISSKIFPGNI